MERKTIKHRDFTETGNEKRVDKIRKRQVKYSVTAEFANSTTRCQTDTVHFGVLTKLITHFQCYPDKIRIYTTCHSYK